MGHYAAVCRSAAAHSVSAAANPDPDDAFLNILDSGSAWTQHVFFDDLPVVMKIDTGADVTAISERLYHEQFGQKHSPLFPPNRVLRGPDGRELPVLGYFKSLLSISSHDQAPKHSVYVVRGLQTPLLGRPAIHALHIFCQISQVQECSTACTTSQINTHFSFALRGPRETYGTAA